MSELQYEEKLSLAPLTKIKQGLDRVFGGDIWLDYELETISLQLGFEFDQLLQDKVNLLKVIFTDPDLFFDDVAFMLYATKVINNEEADFSSVPWPLSLEIGYGVYTVLNLLSQEGYTPVLSDSFKKAISYILRQEGYASTGSMLQFLPEGSLGEIEPERMAQQTQAMNEYITHMENL